MAGPSFVQQAITKSASNITVTLSAYVHAGTLGNYFAMSMLGAAGGNSADVCFNLATGSISLAATPSGGFSNATATISATSQVGLYRCTLTATTDTNATLYLLFSSSSVSQAASGTGSANSTNIYLWGAQLEPGSVAGTYIATTFVADYGIWSGVNGLPVFPYLPGQAIALKKAPLFATKTKRAASGRERRTALWPYPLWQFELSYEVVRHRPANDELATLWEFFNAAQGQYGSWLLLDPSDNYDSGVQFATGDGVSRSFQLARTLNSAIEPVYAVYAPTILDNGAAAGSYAIGANGVVTFATAPAAGHALTWSGYFYYLCRFSQDDMTFQQIVNLLWAGDSLKITSLRP
ncbi:MAG: DUF2460 domain-containing protein [Caulobacteraceae bacterium]|nr:DUF2460 domain-containing protein [Caulobacteraceae bacterium]